MIYRSIKLKERLEKRVSGGGVPVNTTMDTTYAMQKVRKKLGEDGDENNKGNVCEEGDDGHNATSESP
jgi:hypothetical protein